ncbi:DUF302 domain-containing protein [Azospirillum sp.]|uniref:DUF302 domain-containing protein n=1 Tax=Azospirillum sp. TaxID=34012 RepID=UPI003D73571D
MRFEVLCRNGSRPDVRDQGLRDTVLVKELVELLVRFTQPAETKPFMHHCHILEPDDNGMMGQFLTTWLEAASAAVVDCPEPTPIPTATETMMTYHFSRMIDLPFDDAIAATTDALKKHGFGVLTEIDIQATLKKKLDVDYRPYRILGACNPQMAYQALQAEDKIGTMLPCNVIVQQREDGKVEVSAVDPVSSMQAIDNPKLADTAGKVRDMLRQVIDEIGVRA